jgi:hypothetical protein
MVNLILENLQGGLLAQDVEELRAYGYKVEDGTSILTDKNPNYGLTYSKFIPVLIKGE